MGGVGVTIDPSINLAGIVLAVTLLVVIWQFLGHGSIFFTFLYRKFIKGEASIQTSFAASNTLDKKQSSKSPTWLRKCIPWFRYGLATTYLIAIGLMFRQDYLIFKRKAHSLDRYFVNMLDILAFQLAIACTVCLLWCYASNNMRKFLIPTGLVIFFLDAVVEIILQFYQYPVYHWVQLAELSATGIALLIIPFASIIMIKNMHKLTSF